MPSDAKVLFDFLARLGPPKNLVFFGGEPLLNDRLDYLIIIARKLLPVKCTVRTNGTFLNKRQAKFFQKHGVGVDLILDDSACEKNGDAGLEKYWRAVNAIKILREYHVERIGLFVGVDASEEAGFLSFCRSCGVRPLSRQSNCETATIPTVCPAYKKILAVGVDGRLFPCPHMMRAEFSAGRFDSIGPRDIFSTSGYRAFCGRQEDLECLTRATG